jgi:hypothetical protein
MIRWPNNAVPAVGDESGVVRASVTLTKKRVNEIHATVAVCICRLFDPPEKRSYFAS